MGRVDEDWHTYPESRRMRADGTPCWPWSGGDSKVATPLFEGVREECHTELSPRLYIGSSPAAGEPGSIHEV